MDPWTTEAIEELARKSYAGEMHFGALIGKLHELGIESYFADYRAERITYYAIGGATFTIALHSGSEAMPMQFDAPAVQDAIRKSQRGEIIYPEFLTLSRQAGTVGYFVWIAGRHVAYYGRCGEVHIERFPD